MRYLLLLIILAGFISCSEEDKFEKQQQNTQSIQQGESDNPADSILTREEKFSASIMADFLGDSDDEDLAGFLETQIYKMGTLYNGAAVVEVTPSTWLVTFDKDSTVKNYLLQKYVDFKTNECYFSLKETTLTLTDIISNRKNKTSSGE